jgi:DNA modification methylase
VAEKLGRRWVGAEINQKYVDLAHKYIEAWRAQGVLDFGEASNG